MTSERTQIQVYGRAQGSMVPPLLMNPDPTWTVKLFTKVATRSLGVSVPGAVAYKASCNERLDPAMTLAEAQLLPYEMLEFRVE
ncbi:MAG: hypothetical protein ACRDY7_13345 [Acidimicrobiia bacterium]